MNKFIQSKQFLKFLQSEDIGDNIYESENFEVLKEEFKKMIEIKFREFIQSEEFLTYLNS